MIKIIEKKDVNLFGGFKYYSYLYIVDAKAKQVDLTMIERVDSVVSYKKKLHQIKKAEYFRFNDYTVSRFKYLPTPTNEPSFFIRLLAIM